jgi:SAM-dependent methyltransferase
LSFGWRFWGSHFNQSAQFWDTPEKIEKAKEHAERIKRILKPLDLERNYSSILEIGCGTGLLGAHFMSDSCDYLGVDASEQMLQVLKRKFPQPQVRVQNVDVESDEFIAPHFDLLLSQMAFHHLRQPGALLKKLANRQKALYVIIDLDHEDGTFHPDPQKMGVHHFGFAQEEVNSWGYESGLKLMHYSVLDVIKKNNKSYPQFLAIFC